MNNIQRGDVALFMPCAWRNYNSPGTAYRTGRLHILTFRGCILFHYSWDAKYANLALTKNTK